MLRIGIISDTHGHLSDGALKALGGVDRIIHAGDIGGTELLQALERIAPVTAVRGNMDYGGWADNLPVTDMVEFDGTCFYILHNLNALDLDPEAAGVRVVISGHTHQSLVKTVNGVLYMNPGSASAGRYGSPESIGMIKLDATDVIPRILPIG